jgi:hypothetical protein
MQQYGALKIAGQVNGGRDHLSAWGRDVEARFDLNAQHRAEDRLHYLSEFLRCVRNSGGHGSLFPAYLAS